MLEQIQTLQEIVEGFMVDDFRTKCDENVDINTVDDYIHFLKKEKPKAGFTDEDLDQIRKVLG